MSKGTITHRPVKSSMIQSVGHNPDTLDLEIKFKNGKVYTYANITEDQFNELADADSVGKYFNERIAGREK